MIGPDGAPLTMSDLPSPKTNRWLSQRKAVVVFAVRGGLLSLDEACRRYRLTLDEFCSWQNAVDCFGMPGLRTTRTQYYRQLRSGQGPPPSSHVIQRSFDWKRQDAVRPSPAELSVPAAGVLGNTPVETLSAPLPGAPEK